MKREEIDFTKGKIPAIIFGTIIMLAWIVAASKCFDSEGILLYPKIFWYSLIFIALAIVVVVSILTRHLRQY